MIIFSSNLPVNRLVDERCVRKFLGFFFLFFFLFTFPSLVSVVDY